MELNLDVSVEEVSLDTGIPLGLVVNELLTHSIRCGFPVENNKVVNIEMYLVKEEYVVVYTDTSYGFDLINASENIFWVGIN